LSPASEATAGEALAAAREAGIHRIAVPTPFAVGRVNAYLIEDDPLTLVDSGPNSGRSLDELEQGLRALGREIEELGLIVISHQHMDHLGLVSILASRSGAEVAAIDVAVPFIENYAEAAAADDDFASQIMVRHGIPADVMHALRSVSQAFRAWGAAATVTRPLADGERLELRDRSLEVHFRPGHSPTDTVFFDADRRQLLAADHLLKDISSNPLISRPAGGEDRAQSLAVYLESLRRTREMEVDLVLPGHGEPITDHRALIDSRLELHRRRADKLRRLIAERPRTAHELAQALWGDIAVTQAFLTLSEVLGHTDLLLNDGLVRELEHDGVVHFEAVA